MTVYALEVVTSWSRDTQITYTGEDREEAVEAAEHEFQEMISEMESRYPNGPRGLKDCALVLHHYDVTRDEFNEAEEIDDDWNEDLLPDLLRCEVDGLAEDVLCEIESDSDADFGHERWDVLETIEERIIELNKDLPDDVIYSDYLDYDGFDVRHLADVVINSPEWRWAMREDCVQGQRGAVE